MINLPNHNSSAGSKLHAFTFVKAAQTPNQRSYDTLVFGRHLETTSCSPKLSKAAKSVADGSNTSGKALPRCSSHTEMLLDRVLIGLPPAPQHPGTVPKCKACTCGQGATGFGPI